MECNLYKSPDLEVWNLEIECGFCQSGTEGLGEKPGRWDIGDGLDSSSDWD